MGLSKQESPKVIQEPKTKAPVYSGFAVEILEHYARMAIYDSEGKIIGLPPGLAILACVEGICSPDVFAGVVGINKGLVTFELNLPEKGVLTVIPRRKGKDLLARWKIQCSDGTPS